MPLCEPRYCGPASKTAPRSRGRAGRGGGANSVSIPPEEDLQAAGITDSEHLGTPTVKASAPEAKPVRKMRKRYVNRNGVWLRVKRLKRFHPGEKVYVKDADQKFQVIGQVSKSGKPPAIYLEDKV